MDAGLRAHPRRTHKLLRNQISIPKVENKGACPHPIRLSALPQTGSQLGHTRALSSATRPLCKGTFLLRNKLREASRVSGALALIPCASQGAMDAPQSGYVVFPAFWFSFVPALVQWLPKSASPAMPCAIGLRIILGVVDAEKRYTIICVIAVLSPIDYAARSRLNEATMLSNALSPQKCAF